MDKGRSTPSTHHSVSITVGRKASERNYARVFFSHRMHSALSLEVLASEPLSGDQFGALVTWPIMACLLFSICHTL